MTPEELQRQYQQEDAYAKSIQQGLLVNDARNQQVNALNIKLDKRQKDGKTPLDDWNDKRIAEIQAQKANPIFQKEQVQQEAKANAQSLAQALLGTKQVESMSYGGNPVKQSPDGKYWLENGQEVTDTANIQSNNKFDPIAASINAIQDTGNPLALAALQEQMKPKLGMDTADKLAMFQAQLQMKKDMEQPKPKKDISQKDITQAMNSLGVKDYYNTDNNNIFSALNEASDDSKKFDATISAINSNTSDGLWRRLIPFLPNKSLDTSGFTQTMQNYKSK